MTSQERIYDIKCRGVNAEGKPALQKRQDIIVFVSKTGEREIECPLFMNGRCIATKEQPACIRTEEANMPYDPQTEQDGTIGGLTRLERQKLKINLAGNVRKKPTLYKMLGVHNEIDALLQGIKKGAIDPLSLVDRRKIHLVHQLTRKEKEILATMVNSNFGERNVLSTIAEELGKARGTIRIQLLKIYKKLNVNTMTQAALYYIANQIDESQ